MSQRNPLNERYQTERTGKTRKSAASAKPTSKAASSVRMETKKAPEKRGFFGQRKSSTTEPSKKDGEVQRATKEHVNTYNPDTPEYHKWRRIWLVTLVCALVLTLASMFVTQQEGFQVIGYVMLGLGYALLFGGLDIDLRIIRRIRRAYQEQVASMSGKSKEATRQRKEARAAARKNSAQAADASEASKADAGKQGGVLKGLFGKKSASGASGSGRASANDDGAASPDA